MRWVVHRMLHVHDEHTFAANCSLSLLFQFHSNVDELCAKRKGETIALKQNAATLKHVVPDAE